MSSQPTPTPAPAATPTQPTNTQPTDTQPTPATTTTPALGTRIEVLWRIESDATSDNPDRTILDRWWGAIVQDRHTHPTGTSTHTLLYDAFGEFEEDTAEVKFQPDHRLIDLSRISDADGGVLDWRMEGEGRDEEGGEVVLTEFAQREEMMDREAGVGRDEDLRVLSGMPAEVQRRVASGYRVFADGVRERIGEILKGKPNGYVVTEQDVRGVLEEMRRNAGRDGEGVM